MDGLVSKGTPPIHVDILSQFGNITPMQIQRPHEAAFPAKSSMILQIENFQVALTPPYAAGMAISEDEADVLNEEHFERLKRNIRRWQEAGWTKSKLDLAVANFKMGEAWVNLQPETPRQKRARELLELGL
jgi:hypothetical protein